MRTDLFVKHLTSRLPRIREAKKNVHIFSGAAYQIKKFLTALCKKRFFYFRRKCLVSYSQLLSYPNAYLAREIRRLLLAVISFILRTFNIFGHNTGGLYAVNKKS